jgi:hypothetical protein
MRCIFWLEEQPPSPEHVIPRAMGGTVTTGRVCASATLSLEFGWMRRSAISCRSGRAAPSSSGGDYADPANHCFGVRVDSEGVPGFYTAG